MYFDKKKKCFVADDGSKLKPTKSCFHQSWKAYQNSCVRDLQKADKLDGITFRGITYGKSN